MKNVICNDGTCSLPGRFTAWLLVVILALSIGAAIRLWEVGDWNQPQLRVDGEVLLSKHDGYGWLAGAKRINQHSATPFASSLRFLHEATSIPLDRLAFWLPAVLAPLAALPVCLLAFWWRIPEAGVVAGAMAGSSIGYFIRTRVSCLDTDLLTLFFPLCLAAGLIIWLESAAPSTRDRTTMPSPGVFLCSALLLGLLHRCSVAFYPSGEVIGLSIMASALIMGLMLATPRYRPMIAIGILIMGLAGNGHWQEIGLAASITILAFLRPALVLRNKAVIFFIVLLGLLGLWWFSDLTAKASTIWFHLSRYSRVADNAVTTALPPVIETVPEAWPVDFTGAVFFLTGNWPLWFTCITGLAIVLWKHPAAILLLPLLALGLASVRLGIRFTMYGGAILGLGLACGTALSLRALQVPRWISPAAQIGLFAVICWPLIKTVDAMNPEPVVNRQLASALSELKRLSAPESQVWIWWDQGYEAQYFGERMTFADGYRNSAEEIFPLAYVLAASSPLSAYQMITRCALQQRAAGPLLAPDTRHPLYPSPFPNLLGTLPPVSRQFFLDGLRHPKVAWSHELPEQYLVVTWENLQRAHTILAYGTWDFIAGRPDRGNFRMIRQRASFDMDKGLMKARGKTYRLRSKEIISDNTGKRVSWPRHEGWHAIEKTDEGFIYLFDDGGYQAMMVQMLLADPARFQPYFDLVLDRFPSARIYRINPILTALPPGSIIPAPTAYE